ncbi:MAG: Fic family protein [Pseudomonadota bacterium]
MKNLLKTSLNPVALKSIKAIGAFRELWTLSKSLDRDFYAGLKKTTIITSAGASTRIEGAHLSDEEIISRLEGLKIQKIQDRDEAEVAGYIDCLSHIFDHFRELEITEHAVRSLHQMMCSYLSEDVLPLHQRGAYKNVPNSVVRIDGSTGRKEIIFETTPPGTRTEMEMRDLVQDYNEFLRDPNYDDLEVIAAFVVKFLAIHPFRDGNGRLSRVLTNLCLLRQGYEFCMYSSHEKVVEDNKDAYYIALRQTQATLGGVADLNPWLIFFLKALDRQTGQLKDKIETKASGQLTALEEKTVELIRLHQPATIGFIERRSGIGRPTLKAILARLQKKGVIAMEGERKGSKYRMK